MYIKKVYKEKGRKKQEMKKSKKKKGKEKGNNSSHTKNRLSTFNLEAAVNIKITPLGNVLKMHSGKQKP